jgi:hypothetical protein
MLNLRLCTLGMTLLTLIDALVPLIRPTKVPTLALHATIYFNQDEYCSLDDCDGDDDDDDDGSTSFLNANQEDAPVFLHSPNILGSLARLAVAFGPHKLSLNQIEQVQVSSFDTSHLDLQVVICEEECLTLLVPVAFPKPCHTTDEEECFLDNIHQLDSQATAQIQQWEWEQDHHELVAARARDYTVLKETDSYPSWWQKAGPLSRDCASLKRLLNEPDFQPEIKALVAYHLAMDSQYDLLEIDQVAVADVGPSGILLQASAYEISILVTVDEGDEKDVAKPPKMLQIPYEFPTAATNLEGIQAAVLQAVAMAGDFMED